MPPEARAISEARLAQLVVPSGAVVSDALRSIDEGGAGLCLMIDEAGALRGLLTDGDIRRALLDGATLDTPVESMLVTDPITVGPGDSRDNVLDAMQERRISAVPIVAADGRLVGLHAMHDLIAPEPRPNWTVIMAGGRGTRLGELTESTPKPMLHVAGRPILERLVMKLAGQGLTRIAISTNYLADAIEAHFGDGAAFGCEIVYLRESADRPLGTGGSLTLLRAAGVEPRDPLVVLNGDVITDTWIPDLIDGHERSGNSLTLAVTEYRHTVPFGVVRSEDGRLVELVEKPTERWLVNAGVYVVAPPLLDAIPENVDFPMTDLVAHALDADLRVGDFSIAGSWIDIGRPDELSRARGEGPEPS